MIELGNLAIQVTPGEVMISSEGGEVRVHLPESVLVRVENNKVVLESDSKMYMNTMISLINSAIAGLGKPHSKIVSIIGVGYEVEVVKEARLRFAVGYSHPVYYTVPDGVGFDVMNKKTLRLHSPSKQMLGQALKNVEMIRKPNPYTGNGLFIEGKFYLRKKMLKGK